MGRTNRRRARTTPAGHKRGPQPTPSWMRHPSPDRGPRTPTDPAGAEHPDRLSPPEAAQLGVQATLLARAASEAFEVGDGDRAQPALAALVALAPGPAQTRIVQQAVIDLLQVATGTIWQRGWQPRDVHEVLGRDADRLVVDLAGDVMADDLAGYARALVDPRWFAQLTGIGASVWWPADRTWASGRTASTPGGWPLVLEAATCLLSRLERLGPLERFLPLPGQASGATPRPAPVEDAVLHRVRRMLAKAESTSFEAEAASFTAAAQRLMSRHSIDRAMLAASDPVGAGEGPTGRRIWVPRPYVKEKVVLINVVAESNRSRAIWSKELDMVTLLGHDPDLDAVETLYTSLLVQATGAMHAEGKKVTAWGSSRTRGFRQAFLAAYASRIGERLREAARAETQAAAAEYSDRGAHALVPILAAREEQVDHYVQGLFPQMVRTRVSAGSDPDGWASGRQAADLAQFGPETAHRPAT